VNPQDTWIDEVDAFRHLLRYALAFDASEIANQGINIPESGKRLLYTWQPDVPVNGTTFNVSGYDSYEIEGYPVGTYNNILCTVNQYSSYSQHGTTNYNGNQPNFRIGWSSGAHASNQFTLKIVDGSRTNADSHRLFASSLEFNGSSSVQHYQVGNSVDFGAITTIEIFSAGSDLLTSTKINVYGVL